MKDFSKYRIIKYDYPFSTDELGERIWDKMTNEEAKWAAQLTLKGVNDTGGDEETSWDIFFLDEKLKNKIESILTKYEIPFETQDISSSLMDNFETFTEQFIKKINSYLDENLTVDDVLDRILEVGLEGLTVFEKYYLDNNVEIKQENKKS